MATEYTNGPWFWDAEVPTEYRDDYYIQNAPWLTTASGSVITGQICVPNPADLPLLAAAPELLEALKYHHNWQLTEGQREGFGYINSKPYIDTVAAIAKAEGK